MMMKGIRRSSDNRVEETFARLTLPALRRLGRVSEGARLAEALDWLGWTPTEGQGRTRRALRGVARERELTLPTDVTTPPEEAGGVAGTTEASTERTEQHAGSHPTEGA
jgi:hypothetical protein